MRTYRNWAADGTFYVCPKSFKQLYTLNVIIENSSLPCIYILSERLLQSTYERIFNVVKNALGLAVTPLTLITDFEIAAQQAAVITWPTVIIRSCLFHMGQSVFRHVQSLGLNDLYLTNTDVRNAIRSLQALSVLMEHEVREGFDAIRASIEPAHPRLTPLFVYFEETYVGNVLQPARFPHAVWNCHDTITTHLGRTNNSVEGWHSAFNKKFRGSPTLSKLLTELKLEELDMQSRITRYQIDPLKGIATSKRLKKYEDVDERVEIYVTAFDNWNPATRDILAHLKFLQSQLAQY